MWQPGFSPTLDDLFRGRLARVYHSAIWAVSHWAISPLLSRNFLHLEANNLRKSSFAAKMAKYRAIFGQCFGLRIWTTRVPVERYVAVFVETKKDEVDKEAEKKRPKRSEVNLTPAKR